MSVRTRKFFNILLPAIWPFPGIAMVFTVLGLLSIESWIPDLACQFFLHYLLLLSWFLGFLLLARRYGQSLVLVPFILICVFKLVPLFLPQPARAINSSPVVKLLQVNVNSANREYGKVIACVKRYDPDVVVFEEVNDAWLSNLAVSLGPVYRTVQARPRKDNFGIAMFSKIPDTESKVFEIGYSRTPTVYALFQKGLEPFGVIGTHVLPPTSGDYFRERNLQYDELAMLSKKLDERLVLLGDLNTTIWSPFFSGLVSKTNLQDSSLGYGIQATWPACMGVLGVDLEHCLYSDHFSVLKREVGPDVGSDHKPLYVELAIVK